MSAAPRGGHTPVRDLLPMGMIAFLLFATIAIPLPALAIHLHDNLGLGPVAVGWVIGAQSIVTVVCRNSAGRIVDGIGPKRAVLIGLPLGALSGLCYSASTLLAAPAAALTVILLGRALLGVGESLILTSTVTWSIGRLGPQATAPAIATQGLAIYAALGLGAPVGLWTQEHYGFAAVGLVTLCPCLLAFAPALPNPAIPARGRERAEVTPLSTVLRWVGAPGVLVFVGTVGYAGLASFLALLYRARGWEGAALAFAGFAVGFILVRVVGMGLAARRGGWQVAAGSLAIEAVGQGLLCLAPTPMPSPPSGPAAAARSRSAPTSLRAARAGADPAGELVAASPRTAWSAYVVAFIAVAPAAPASTPAVNPAHVFATASSSVDHVAPAAAGPEVVLPVRWPSLPPGRRRVHRKQAWVRRTHGRRSPDVVVPHASAVVPPGGRG